MTTYIRTAKARYQVESLEIPLTGPIAIVVRQPSGKRRHLHVTDVGRPRFDAAVARYLATRKQEGATP